MKNLFLVLMLISTIGCSSTKPKKGAYGEWSQDLWNAHVGVGTRLGYDSSAINLFRLGSFYAAGIGRDNWWWYMAYAGGGNAYAWNDDAGRYHRKITCAGDPANPAGEPAPPTILSHESGHSYIEDSPEHGGSPLPAEFRRGGDGHYHPKEIYVNGRWRSVRNAVQSRWPFMLNDKRKWGGTEPLRCRFEGDPNVWHDQEWKWWKFVTGKDDKPEPDVFLEPLKNE